LLFIINPISQLPFEISVADPASPKTIRNDLSPSLIIFEVVSPANNRIFL
jgi:hypothetical protein